MRAGDLSAADVGRTVVIDGRVGVLKAIGRRATTVTDVWMTVHIEVRDGSSVLFLREAEQVEVT